MPGGTLPVMSAMVGAFQDDTDDQLAARLQRWETSSPYFKGTTQERGFRTMMLRELYREQEERVNRKLLAWIEGK